LPARSEVICLQRALVAGLFMNAAVYEATEVRPLPLTSTTGLLRHQVGSGGVGLGA
jgi:hypothetical protein